MFYNQNSFILIYLIISKLYKLCPFVTLQLAQNILLVHSTNKHIINNTDIVELYAMLDYGILAHHGSTEMF